MKLGLTAEAEADLASHHEWYEDERPGLGAEFLEAVENRFDQISGNPYLYPVSRAEVRRALVRRFPYAVFYMVEDEEIVVIAIEHQARDPEHWHSRVR